MRRRWSVMLAGLALGPAGAAPPPLPQQGGYSCVLEPSRTAEIRSVAPGLITAIRARRGEQVRAGQVLVEIDASVEQAAAEVAKHRATMEGGERVGLARMEFARLKAQRQQELVAEAFVAQSERDAAQAEFDIATAELADARENRRLADLEHRRLQEAVRQRTVRAPFDAVVIERFAHPGEAALVGESSRPLLKLADIGTLHVEALLPAAMWSRVRTGQQLLVDIDPVLGGSVSGKVVVVDRVLDPASVTFGVRLEVPNPQLKLPAGVRCKVRLS